MPHTNFPKVTWVTFVKVDSVMIQPTSIPLTSQVLPVLANAAMALAHVAPKLSGLPGQHLNLSWKDSSWLSLKVPHP